MPRAPLPDPTWTEAAAVCIGCGYSLQGLAVPGRCPECGAHYEARQLILAGVARTPASAPRRLAWIAIGGLIVILSQLWPFFLFVRGLWLVLLLILAAAIIGGAIILTLRPRDRHGTERFCLTPSGLARVPAAFDPAAQRLAAIPL